MAEKFKLSDSGKCNVCQSVPAPTEILKCYFCKGAFHGLCSQAGGEKIATKSLVTNFNASSTNENFKFFCDICLTKFEIDTAKTNDDRLCSVEKNVTKIISELGELKNFLKKDEKSAPPVSENYNVWNDLERLQKTKIPPCKPILILDKKDTDKNDSIEKLIVENKIPVTNILQSKAGDTLLVCDSITSRDKLKKLTSENNMNLKPVAGKKLNITIVGLQKEYSKEEVITQLMVQNEFLNQLNVSNDINDHISVHIVKPTRLNEKVFQVFASVSEALRDGLRNHLDKITVGMSVCKVYDRTFVKRCNNCQGLGHYFKECPIKDSPSCAKCGGDHRTDACDSSVKKCINCTRKGAPLIDHFAFDPKCPQIVSFSTQNSSPSLNL